VSVDRVALGPSVALEYDEALRARALRRAGHLEEDAVLPPVARAAEHAGRLAPDRVPHAREELERLGRVDEAHPPLALERAGEPGVLTGDRDLGALRRHPVPEPAVDRVLGGPEQRERLTAHAEVVELRTHHRTEDTASAMRRERADDRDAAGRDDRTRDGELERERAGAADDDPVLARGVHALDREVSREALHALLGRLHAEVLADREDRLAELVEVAAGPHLEAHGIF
jgi:hypothetical protein